MQSQYKRRVNKTKKRFISDGQWVKKVALDSLSFDDWKDKSETI